MSFNNDVLTALNKIQTSINQLQSDARISRQQLAHLAGQIASQRGMLERILAEVSPAPPVKLSIQLTGEMTMSAAKASLDFQLADNGTANATLGLVDAAGLPTNLPSGATLSVPAWVSSSPDVVVTPAADGMSAVIAPSNPPVLVTDATITVGPATLTNADGTTVTLPAVTSEGIDVVGGGPAGFSISL